MRSKTIKKLNLRPYLSGLLPLFLLAHFGHHVVGSILRPLMPMIRTDLGLSYTQSGLTMSAFSVTSGISQLPSGWLADRFGSRLMVLLSVTGVAIAGLLIGLSHSYMALIAFLVVAAIMGGGYHPAASATVSMSVPPEYRGRTLALHMIGGSSAFWIVPLLAAPIATAWGWRSSYITLTIPTIILGILLYILLGRQRQSHVGEFLKLDSEVRTESAGIHWQRLVPFIIISVATTTAIQSVSAYLSLYAVDSLGLSEATAAMLMAISPAVGLFAIPVGGYLSDRFGSMQVLLAISFLAIPFIYLLGIASSAQALAALMVALGIVSGSRMPASESYIAGNTPDRRRATVLGLYFFGNTEGSGLLVPLLGTLIDRFGFYFCFTITSAATTAVLMACSLFLWRNRK
ncbi:MFS transporter [Chloroflexota bacterium]